MCVRVCFHSTRVDAICKIQESHKKAMPSVGGEKNIILVNGTRWATCHKFDLFTPVFVWRPSNVIYSEMRHHSTSERQYTCRWRDESLSYIVLIDAHNKSIGVDTCMLMLLYLPLLIQNDADDAHRIILSTRWVWLKIRIIRS